MNELYVLAEAFMKNHELTHSTITKRSLSMLCSQVVFVPRSSVETLSLRQIRAQHIGKLVSFRGIVTRVGGIRTFRVVLFDIAFPFA